MDGQKLGTYALTLAYGNSVYLTDSNTNLAVFFGGKRVAVAGSAFAQDRLGSNTAGKYFPHGEDRGTPAPNDQVKFATYTRDSATLLDYADQRYYSNQFGRFMTPDPYKASAGVSNPQSWNRYAYVIGDPINFFDPFGLTTCFQMPDGSISCYDSVDVRDTFEPIDPVTSVIPSFLEGHTPNPNSDRESEHKLDAEEAKRQSVCNKIPDGRTMGVSAGVGILGGQVGTLELVINYNTGQISGFASGGLQAGLGSGASIAGVTGFIWGLGNTNSNFSGPFTNGTLTVGIFTGFASATSGGLTAPATLTTPLVVGGGIALSLLPNPSFTVSETQYSNPLNIGSIANSIFALLFPTDYSIFKLRQELCY